MAATLRDIARATGLSVATVSKYINGATLREKNRVAIERAIRELDYTVNEYARGLKSNRSRTIGVLIPELSNLFITQIITRIEEVLRASGYSAIICDCRSDGALECEVVQFLLGKMVDGVINMPVCRDGRHLRPALDKDVPVVLLDRAVAGLDGAADSVLLDNEGAARAATDLLLQNGHRRIGIIIGPDGVYTARHRLAGYRVALAEYGVPDAENLIAYTDYTLQGGYEGMRSLLTVDNGMTAVFATNYELTLGAVIAAGESGVRIPEDLSFIGFDNLDLSRVTHPKLTIVSQPLREMGTRAAKLILGRLGAQGLDAQAGSAPVSVSLPAAIVPGASVRRL